MFNIPVNGYGLSFFFFLLILARSNYDHNARECNFGILKKKQKQNKKQKKKTKKKQKKIIRLCFYLNEECPRLLSSLGIDHRRRKTIPLWYSPGGKKSSSGHHCMSGIYNIGHCVMTW